MNCKNCHNTLTSNTNFCPHCGAKIIKNRLTLKALFASFSEQYLNFDNKFLKTFLHLFSNPKEVIEGYINGVRKRYVNVISYLAIAITISGLQVFILQKFFPKVFEISLPTPEGQEELPKMISEISFEYNSFILIAFIPLLAIIAKMTFYNIKKFNYSELIVALMYIMAHTTIIGAILSIIVAILNINFFLTSILLIPLYIIYTAYCFKELYELSLKRIILKTLFLILIIFVFYILLTIILTIVYLAYTKVLN